MEESNKKRKAGNSSGQVKERDQNLLPLNG